MEWTKQRMKLELKPKLKRTLVAFLLTAAVSFAWPGSGLLPADMASGGSSASTSFKPGTVQAAAGEPGAAIYRNGSPLGIVATILEGRAWIPVRTLMEALGYTVTWDDASHSIRLASPGVVGSGVTAPVPGLELLSSFRSVDGAGYYRIVGEARNPGQETVYGPRVTALLRNANGDLIDTVSAPALLDKVLGGGKVPFVLVSTAKAADVWTVELRLDLQTRYVESAAKPAAGPKVESLTLARFKADDDVISYSGTVVNSGAGDAKDLRAVITGYNAAGTAVAVETGYVTPRDLTAGAHGHYSIPITNNAGMVTSVSVQFEYR